MYDYIIVGQGIAGSCLALEFLKNKKKFIVINQTNNSSASQVAAGMYNPVVLKRFSKIWNAENQLDQLNKTFTEFDQLLGGSYKEPLTVKRIFHNENEIHTWQKKSKREDLNPYLKPEIQTSSNVNINAKFGLGSVRQTGKIKLQLLLDEFKMYLTNNHLYKEEKFDFNYLKLNKLAINYKNLNAERIVFCDGYNVKNNPYFNWLPIIGNKGEVLDVELKETLYNNIYKSNVFLLPNKQQFYVGTTYDRDFTHENPTQKAKQFLKEGLSKIYTGNYKILNHRAGVRPTVQDRRPIVGKHPKLSQLFVMNGMGTRGTLLAPSMAIELFEYLEDRKSLSPEIDIQRFYNMY